MSRTLVGGRPFCKGCQVAPSSKLIAAPCSVPAKRRPGRIGSSRMTLRLLGKAGSSETVRDGGPGFAGVRGAERVGRGIVQAVAVYGEVGGVRVRVGGLDDADLGPGLQAGGGNI